MQCACWHCKPENTNGLVHYACRSALQSCDLGSCPCHGDSLAFILLILHLVTMCHANLALHWPKLTLAETSDNFKLRREVDRSSMSVAGRSCKPGELAHSGNLTKPNDQPMSNHCDIAQKQLPMDDQTVHGPDDMQAPGNKFCSDIRYAEIKQAPHRYLHSIL